MKAFQGPDQGMVGLFLNESPAGRMADLYADQRHISRPLAMGSLHLHNGSNTLYFKIMGKNAKATGFAFEPVSFVFKRTD